MFSICSLFVPNLFRVHVMFQVCSNRENKQGTNREHFVPVNKP